MIGRFSELGVYRELLTSRDFCVAFAGGLLAAASFALDRGRSSASYAAMALALALVAVNGFPIVWGPIRGLLEGKTTICYTLLC